MSATMTAAGLLGRNAPVSRRVRAYFAPVDRVAGVPTIFDPARDGRFDVEAPPAPWVDLGWCTDFARKADPGVKATATGAPAMVQTQTRAGAGATVEVAFASWGKLQMALCSGSEQMNLLSTVSGVAANGSGGRAVAAVAVLPGSTATALAVGEAAAVFSAGDLVVVDQDYTGQTGFVGAGVSGAYVRAATDVSGGDVDYIRRVSVNVGRVGAVVNGVLTMETPLLAGAPADGMKASRVLGFCDREGGRFFQEWSALFCVDGEQGDRTLYHYPRLQGLRGSSEASEALPGGFERTRLAGAFRALPVVDAEDGARVVCFRSYLPVGA